MGVPLNVDIAGSISTLQDALKDFELRLKLYRILFTGKGLDFDGYREYTSVDDASLIDWKSSMRANKILVKQYKEEQDMKILFVVDIGEHMLTGSTQKIKAEYAVEAVAALMHLVLKSGDRAGLVTFNQGITNVITPKLGNKHFDFVMEILSDSSTYSGGSNISQVTEFLVDYISQSVKGVVFVSDFLTMKPSVLRQMQILGSKFETLAMVIKDPLDKQLPDVSGEVILEDPLTGEQLLVNPRIAQQAYRIYAQKQENMVMEIFKQSGIDVLSLSTDVGFVPALAEFIKERVKQRKFL